ncbi:MAG: 3-phosphoshikimate 1-carboxyvinyltransferase [Lachnospiraceae bacterium]|nr:3-phosphoshikimate 1-carboxyvinyltransferase [Lachnospiraceae bacterium]
MKVDRSNGLRGTMTVPGDKSISHRSVMFGALAEGTTRVRHFLSGADCLSTIDCMSRMGISVEKDNEELLIHGKGLHGLTAPTETLDAGNSGTTTRLLSGILAGQRFSSRITGDSSLTSRPMKRIMEPLTQMGARIRSEQGNGCAPLIIDGAPLQGITYHTPVASAQVKSCILLAGLYAEGLTRVYEPALSRDHTERMLRAFGADVATDADGSIVLTPGRKLTGQAVEVPGDISSAAYFLAAGLLVPNSEIILENVGLNPTRDGMICVIEKMGGQMTFLKRYHEDTEPAADILVRPSQLHGTVIEGAIIPTLIDELPIIAVMAAFAEGETIIKDAAELKVKETDRLALITENLTRMGADITATDDGMIIRGGRPLHGAAIEVQGDHRMAMAFAIAGLLTGDMEIADAACVSVSYPTFFETLKNLSR